MFKLHNVDHIPVDRIPITDGPALAASDGFTTADLIALGDIHAMAIARHLWGRSQLVSNAFAHYLAVWRPEAGATEPPALVLARFKKTGTYLLRIGTTVVASGRRLSTVLPALPSGTEQPRSGECSMPLEAAD